MKVLINAINARLGGGQTYLFNLLSHLPRQGDLEVTLLVGPSFGKEFPSEGVTRMVVPSWVENPLVRSWWERFILPSILRRGGFDLLFCPGGVVGTRPPAGCLVVTMFRNMLPFDMSQRRRYPLGYQRLRNWMLSRVMMRSMVRADLVIFVADYARQVIEASLGRALPNRVVIPHGIAARFRFHANTPLQRPEGLPPRYLLYVSNVDVYKAQLEVVQAFAKIHSEQPDLYLILVGPERSFYADRVRRAIGDLGLSQRVQMRGKVPYATLPALYQHAEINIFASECENCPNILLEAMASGRPVVCSDRQPMPEFAGETVRYFDPSRSDTLATAIRYFLADADESRHYAALAMERAALYTWERTSAQTWASIQSLKS